MVIGYAADRSAWDFLNPKNWVINKPLEQNLQEASIGLQIMGTVIPEAWAYKAAGEITAGLASKAAVAATETAAGATTAAGAAGAAGAAAGGIGLATTALEVGGMAYVLNWLKDNWWIAALLIGGYFLIKKK